jgi:hypothetical protein
MMKLSVQLFCAFVAMELFLFAMSYACHSSSTSYLITTPLIPTIMIAMALGGVHTAGFLSFAVGIISTAAVYTLVAAALAKVVAKLRKR